MKENKKSIKVLSIISIINLVAVIYFPNEGSLGNIISISFGGVTVSLIVAVITYFTEERKSIYNFYVAADRYTEKLKCFSQFLAESCVHFGKIPFEEDKQELVEIVIKRLEKVFDELYEEYIIIQKETREFEAYHITTQKKDDIGWYMRTFYNSTKDDMYNMRNCEEWIYRNKLSKKENYKMIASAYEKLCFVFLEKEENENEFILIKCKCLDYILDKFIDRGFISLRKNGKMIRNAQYDVILENDCIKQNNNFSNGMLKDGFSTCREPKKTILDKEEDWFDDVSFFET